MVVIAIAVLVALSFLVRVVHAVLVTFPVVVLVLIVVVKDDFNKDEIGGLTPSNLNIEVGGGARNGYVELVDRYFLLLGEFGAKKTN